MTPRALRLFSLCSLALALVACGTVDGASQRVVQSITPYRVDVVQGNFISREQVEVLKPGMSRLQVRDILGTPLLASVFHASRWDYVFTLKRQGVADQQRRFTVIFDGDRLVRFEGDPMPSEEEFAASIRPPRQIGKLPELELPESERNAAPANANANRAAPAAPAPQPPARTTPYPPLESSAAAPARALEVPAVYVPAPALPDEVQRFVAGWMDDWHARNAAGFVARYAPDFRGAAASRIEWEQQIQRRLAGTGRLTVAVDQLRGQVVSDAEVRVQFRQAFESDTDKEVGLKALFLRKVDGRWLIEREIFTPAT